MLGAYGWGKKKRKRQANVDTDAKRERGRPLALLPWEHQEAGKEVSHMSEWSHLPRLLSPEGGSYREQIKEIIARLISHSAPTSTESHRSKQFPALCRGSVWGPPSGLQHTDRAGIAKESIMAQSSVFYINLSFQLLKMENNPHGCIVCACLVAATEGLGQNRGMETVWMVYIWKKRK